MNAVLLASAVLIGCLLAVQAAANLQLNKTVGTPYGASTLQLWFAAVLLAALAMAVGALGALGGVFDSASSASRASRSAWGRWPDRSPS